MTLPSEKYFELLNHRLELLRTLIRAESDWRRAFVRLDLRAAQNLSADESSVCQELLSLDRELTSLRTGGPKTARSPSGGNRVSASASAESSPIVEPKVQAALQEMAKLHDVLRRSNQVRRGILRRANLTVNSLNNLLNSYAPTYAAPASPRVGAIYEETV